MEKRIYKDKDEVSLIGFGCMRLPVENQKTQKIDFEKAEKLIDYAYEKGVNYFDTAYAYHNGDSEVFIGEVLKKYPRDSYYLADKMPTWLLEDYSDGEKYFEEQLKRCQVDYFDFYLLHTLGKPDTDFIERYIKTGIYEYLVEEKKKGRIKNLGFSFHGQEKELKEILDNGEWDFAQIQLNYLDWDIQHAKTYYEMLEEKNIPCIVMEPIRGGNLVKLCDESIDILKKENPNASIASWALRYAASLPNVLTVLSGMSNMEHVEDNMATFNSFSEMSEREYQVLEVAKKKYIDLGTIPCTGCRYCMDCPFGVDIPEVFSIYNKNSSLMSLPVSFDEQYIFSPKFKMFIEDYNTLTDDKKANNCVDCKKCVKECPQGIQIPEHMKKISRITKLAN